MTSFLPSPHLSLLLLWALLISPAVSANCNSQNFTGRDRYVQCLDLVNLSAYLHYSYDPANTTLSVAFSAEPSNPAGYIAWAINPIGVGMIGAQTLAAYRDSSNGAVTVKTYRIDSYDSVVRSNISFEVWDMKGEGYPDGTFRIFSKIKIPADLAASGRLNHVWQVGPGVTDDGQLSLHEFEMENLGAKAKLKLTTDTAQDRPAGSPTLSENPRQASAGSRREEGKSAFYVIGLMGSLFLL